MNSSLVRIVGVGGFGYKIPMKQAKKWMEAVGEDPNSLETIFEFFDMYQLPENIVWEIYGNEIDPDKEFGYVFTLEHSDGDFTTFIEFVSETFNDNSLIFLNPELISESYVYEEAV